MNAAINDVSTWIDRFKKNKIPVLRQTARALTKLKQNEAELSAHSITEAVLNDPFMVFRILSYAKKHQGKRQLQDLVEVEPAVLMMGTNAFYHNLSPDLLVDDLLKSDMSALVHLLKLIKRANRAAYFAADWAAMHKDIHFEEIWIATLLHDIAEMLMWCFAPDKMNTIFALQQADKTLRSKAVQEKVLGFEITELQKTLVEAFQLPPLLSKLMEDEASHEHRTINVTLAVNLARHSSHGWDDEALPDDYEAIAEFLRVDVERAMFLVGVPKKEGDDTENTEEGLKNQPSDSIE